ncbi:MAG: hypothetical protein IKH18_11140 [Clostridia bacterium]|nr:hypothetical protein [Clostridia bacterium]
MKFAMIGQDIPMLLPTLLADLLFAGKESGAVVAVEEGNPAMRELLTGYGAAVFRKAGAGGQLLASADRAEILSGADCVFYAGDCQAASRFFQDRSALGSDDGNDPGLTDQARVNGGIGGLLHTLRAGNEVLRLCDAMDSACPKALVIDLGQPVARMTELFLSRGYECFSLGRTPLRGANGLDTLCKRLRLKPSAVSAVIAGLPSFAFLLEMKAADTGEDLLPKLKKAAEKNELGVLSRRWLDWWGALPVGDITDHAEFLPAQPDYVPEERPEFGETVQRRKDRILYMNTVREKGTEDREGAMAQLLLLSRVPPIRPAQLALALLRKETVRLPAVTRLNRGELPQLPDSAIIESDLVLENGVPVPQGIILPGPLADIMSEIDETSCLAARAATGDRAALRECVETDPALAGLDRLYCQDVVSALIELHQDVLPLFT